MGLHCAVAGSCSAASSQFRQLLLDPSGLGSVLTCRKKRSVRSNTPRDDEYNQGLSERRAEAVKRALVAEGMADPRVATEGYGEMRPRFHNAETEAQHAINRRVEFVVVQATPAEASAEAEAATQTPTEDE